MITMADLPPERRKALLATNVQSLIADGWRVESQSEFHTVVSKGQGVSPVMHVVHLVMTLASVGLWIVIWLVHILSARIRRRMVTVDDFGNVAVQVVRS